MSEKLSEWRVVEALAGILCQRLARRIIRDLQEMDGCLLSGDDSGLRNVWDEICAHVQGSGSFYGDQYRSTIAQATCAALKSLAKHEREAVWLQTPQALEWDCEDETERDPYPVNDDDIVEYLISGYVLEEAGQWSNARIRAYLDE